MILRKFQLITEGSSLKGTKVSNKGTQENSISQRGVSGKNNSHEQLLDILQEFHPITEGSTLEIY